MLFGQLQQNHGKGTCPKRNKMTIYDIFHFLSKKSLHKTNLIENISTIQIEISHMMLMIFHTCTLLYINILVQNKNT
jgi:hypothetical protein